MHSSADYLQKPAWDKEQLIPKPPVDHLYEGQGDSPGEGQSANSRIKEVSKNFSTHSGGSVEGEPACCGKQATLEVTLSLSRCTLLEEP